MLLKTIILVEQPQDLTNGQLQMATEAQLLAIINHFYMDFGSRKFAERIKVELDRRGKKVVMMPSFCKDGVFREKFYLVNKE